MKRFKLLFFIATCITFCFSCQKNGPGDQVSYRDFNGSYTGDYLNRVAFPLGGMGAGMICMEGTGAISHVSVRNRPDIDKEPQMFSAITVKGYENGTKVIEGPVPEWKIFGLRESGNGLGGKTFGLPRFENASFIARFPFGITSLSDPDIPIDVEITGWSPFIPGYADHSSLPVAAMEYTFTNTSGEHIECLYSFNSENFMRFELPGEWPRFTNEDWIDSIENGFILMHDEMEDAPHTKGAFSAFVEDDNTIVDYCWFRGGWWDPLTLTWKANATMEPRQTRVQEGQSPGASLYVPFTLNQGESKVIRLMFAWHVPCSELSRGPVPEDLQDENIAACCSPSTYSPWYAGYFEDIRDVSEYWKQNYEKLKEGSKKFKEAFYGMDLPAEVIEAIAANLTILKSPTVLRQTNGDLWCWEGCHENLGCCHGSCTHVWNYAQAISHLFPDLERTLRKTEFTVSQNELGHQTFRANLPISEPDHSFHAAADGQLGGIMKAHREWRISGDHVWLQKYWPYIKQSMDYCIKTWDPKHKGILEEPHHNTYDIEFWGPDGMCTSFYLGALKAMTVMGTALVENTESYQELLDKGIAYLEDSLYNGEYFYQIVRTEGLESEDPVTLAQDTWTVNYSAEARDLLLKEGPKYQYGNGCISDGVLGIWLARVCGLDDFIDQEKITSHLVSIYKYNLKYDLSDHVNPQRPSFAMGNDGGLLLCSWPHNDAPSLPFVYSNEVWTGIEYQVASHLMMMGKVEEGLDIVRTCRKRYDGTKRNPFDEYECGHWYARAMSSYGLLQGLTGIRYDAVDKILYIDSNIGDDFTSFIATGTGFGNVGLRNGEPFLEVKHGEIQVEEIKLAGKE